MTWAKYGVEFCDELADLGLSDAAARTHFEAIGYIYRTENTDLRIPARSLRRFAGSPDFEAAAKELTAEGCWRDDGDAYVIVHHADVVRQSLAAQRDRREQEKIRQRRKRAKDQADKPDSVTVNVTRDVRATQTDRHTSLGRRRSPGETAHERDGFSA
jgi:hypothetical protein